MLASHATNTQVVIYGSRVMPSREIFKFTE